MTTLLNLLMEDMVSRILLPVTLLIQEWMKNPTVDLATLPLTPVEKSVAWVPALLEESWRVESVEKDLTYKDSLTDIWNVIRMLKDIYVHFAEKDSTTHLTLKDTLGHIRVSERYL